MNVVVADAVDKNETKLVHVVMFYNFNNMCSDNRLSKKILR